MVHKDVYVGLLKQSCHVNQQNKPIVGGISFIVNDSLIIYKDNECLKRQLNHVSATIFRAKHIIVYVTVTIADEFGLIKCFQQHIKCKQNHWRQSQIQSNDNVN